MCGPKGSRVRMIVDELEGEKIDIVDYDDDPVIFIKNALARKSTKSPYG